MIEIILIYITIILILKIKQKIEKLKEEIFISNPNDYLKNFLILIGFVIGFIFLFRILRLFFSKTSYIYFEEYNWVFYDITKTKILIVLLFLTLLFFFKKLITIYVKLSFVKILLFNFDKINTIFLYLKNLYIYGIKKNYLYLVVFPRILNYLIIILQLIFNDYYIYLGWLPWYALYYFVINCLIFYGDFKSNFDAGVCIFYKGIDLTEYGFFKLRQYQIFLIFNDKRYIFVDDIDVLKNKNILLKEEVLYFDSNDYEIINA